MEQVEKMAGLFDEAGGQGITTWVGRSKGQTDQVPNLERAGVNTQTRPGAEGELGEGGAVGLPDDRCFSGSQA